MSLLAALIGYVIGSMPTAGLLGRLWGVDLLGEGSGNPGTANALRTSGARLAATVLVVEAAKGYAAVLAGSSIAGETGAMAAGLGAVAGNVYNVWYHFGGGKGLGISLGVLAAAWPAALVPVLVVLVGAVLISRSSGIASLAAVVALIASSVLWTAYDWPTGGIEATGQLVVLSAGMALVLIRKHWRDSPFNKSSRRAPRSAVSPGRR
jgi:glycerol-3-phosphate acyltransferase PlsY